MPVQPHGPHILVVEDDPTDAKVLKFLLMDDGYRVRTAGSALDAAAALEAEVYDLILMDVVMPGSNGLAFCRSIRSAYVTPIIFVSGLCEVPDKVAGLQAGADDYIAKPFDPHELLARVGAAIRRSTLLVPDDTGLKNSDLILDCIEHTVTIVRTKQTVSLTPVETRLLRCLVANPGRILSREMLIARVWGPDLEGSSNHLDVYIKRLRDKLAEEGSRTPLLQTIRGVGYRFQPRLN